MITDAAAQPNRLLTSHADMSPMSQRGRQTRPDITTVTMRTSLSQPPAITVRVSGWCEFSIRLLEYLERRCSTRCDLLAVGDPVAVEFVGDDHPRRILRTQRLKPQHTMPPTA